MLDPPFRVEQTLHILGIDRAVPAQPHASTVDQTTTILPSMPNFTISEIITIALVILIVFGPERLPEMAQKAGQLVRKSRSLITDLRREFEGEWQEVAEPLKQISKEVTGIKDEMGESLASLTDDVAKAKKELEEQMAETKQEVERQIAETNKEIKGLSAEPETVATDDPPAGTSDGSSASGESS